MLRVLGRYLLWGGFGPTIMWFYTPEWCDMVPNLLFQFCVLLKFSFPPSLLWPWIVMLPFELGDVGDSFLTDGQHRLKGWGTHLDCFAVLSCDLQEKRNGNSFVKDIKNTFNIEKTNILKQITWFSGAVIFLFKKIGVFRLKILEFCFNWAKNGNSILPYFVHNVKKKESVVDNFDSCCF